MKNMKNMEKLWAWLEGIFDVEAVWIEKEHGQWVKRRRYHPLVKGAALVSVLCLCVLLGRLFFVSGASVEPEIFDAPEVPEVPVESVQSPDVSGPRLRMTDFPDISYPGPIPEALDVTPDEYWVRIDKGDFTLYLYHGTDVEKTYDVAVGKNPGDKERVGDNKTPNGIFTVQSIENSSAWSHDFGDGNGNIRGAYGPWFIRLRTGWSGIGIHGTHDPDSLGSMVSEGCVRMHNSELEELKQFAKVAMKVVIEE